MAAKKQKKQTQTPPSIIESREKMRRAVNLLKLADRKVNDMERRRAAGVTPIISIRFAKKERRTALDRVAEAKKRLRTAVAARKT